MMRWILGEQPFHNALSHFLHTHAFQPADTHDVLTAIKEATGQNLDWFFDEWLLSPGHPVFDVRAEWDAQAKNLTWRIVQTQDTAAGIPIFKTPIVLGAVTSAGRKSEKVWLTGKESLFTFACPEKPLMVRFDEGDYLLKEWTFERPVDELLYQLAHDDVLGRMWAVGQLGRHADDSRVAPALLQSARTDPFWAVRRDALYVLGGYEGPDRQRRTDQHSLDAPERRLQARTVPEPRARQRPRGADRRRQSQGPGGSVLGDWQSRGPRSRPVPDPAIRRGRQLWRPGPGAGRDREDGRPRGHSVPPHGGGDGVAIGHHQARGRVGLGPAEVSARARPASGLVTPRRASPPRALEPRPPGR